MRHQWVRSNLLREKNHSTDFLVIFDLGEPGPGRSHRGLILRHFFNGKGRLSGNNVFDKDTKYFHPGIFLGRREVSTELLLHHGNDGIRHERKILGFDAVRSMFLSKRNQSLGKLFVVLAKHANGAIDHLYQEAGVHDEATAANKLGWIRVDVQRKTEKDLGFRALLEKTARVKGECEGHGRRVGGCRQESRQGTYF